VLPTGSCTTVTGADVDVPGDVGLPEHADTIAQNAAAIHRAAPSRRNALIKTPAFVRQPVHV